MVKARKIENEEIITTMTMTKTLIAKIIITIMIRMRTKIGNQKNVKTE